MHRTASMPTVHRSRLLVAGRAAPDDDDVRLCSVLLASVVSLMLLCGVLSVVPSSADAFAAAKAYVVLGSAAIMLVLLLLGWLAASAIRALAARPPRAPAAAPAPAPVRLARRLCACGLSDAAGVAALPAFPYVAAGAAALGEGDGEQPPRRSGVLCAVCLEHVRAGEMVRQLPACRHLFHVGCVDAWLRSHRTCPLCRCELPRRKAAAQTAAAVTSATPEVVPLPPV